VTLEVEAGGGGSHADSSEDEAFLTAGRNSWASLGNPSDSLRVDALALKEAAVHSRLVTASMPQPAPRL
jgi:hypothetical protein